MSSQETNNNSSYDETFVIREFNVSIAERRKHYTDYEQSKKITEQNRRIAEMFLIDACKDLPDAQRKLLIQNIANKLGSRPEEKYIYNLFIGYHTAKSRSTSLKK